MHVDYGTLFYTHVLLRAFSCEPIRFPRSMVFSVNIYNWPAKISVEKKRSSGQQVNLYIVHHTLLYAGAETGGQGPCPPNVGATRQKTSLISLLMLLINKVWPPLIIGISKLVPHMHQSWLRPWLYEVYYMHDSTKTRLVFLNKNTNVK